MSAEVEVATAIAASAATTATATTTTATKTQRERKRTPLFLSCFWGSSSVVFSDEPQSSGHIKKKKKKQKAPWLSCWHVQKKKKMVPFESSNTTTTTTSPSSSSEVLLKTCFHKKPTIKARDNKSDAQQTKKMAPQLREDVAADSPRQPLLPSISTSQSPDTTQTRIPADQSGLPRCSVSRTAPNSGPARTGRVELLAGLWVMATTLGVMVLFGRAGAVVFLCSCMYIMPVVRAVAGDSGPARNRTDHEGVDFDSEGYKKRVIMEGLLERNGRRPSYAL